MILGEDLEAQRRRAARRDRRASRRACCAQFAEACQQRLAAGDAEWREQFTFQAGSGRRILMCACTPLPVEGDAPGGYVLVFDDITVMLQAQREAAWGEVARRLAHEIKNPLTPIRLSAERMRHKLLPAMTEPRTRRCSSARTETIVQQVEAMKEMVNAFSEYARAPRLEMATRRPQQAGDRGHRPVPRAGRDPRRAPRGRARPARSMPWSPIPAACDSCCTTCSPTRSRRSKGQADGEIAVSTRRVARGDADVARDHGRGQRARVPARADRAGVRSVRDDQDQGHRARARDRAQDRRRTRRAHRGRQPRRGRRTGSHRPAAAMKQRRTARARRGRLEPRRERA